MKKILSIIIFLYTFSYSIILSQWVQQTSGVTTSLLDIDFIDQNTGWACGDNGVVVKTTNGGFNWIQQNTGVIKRLEGIDAVDANTLYSVGWFQTIIKSTNGGTNWNIIRDGPSGMGSTFYKCYFLNQNTGWLLRSGGGYVLRTSNGGVTFDSTFTNNSFNKDIFFKDPMNGVLCGNGAWVMKSTDGGITWNQIALPLATGAPNLYRLSFIGDFGWVIGEGGPFNGGRYVWRTTNFGSTWDSIARVPYPNNELNYSVFFANLSTGYCGGTTGYIFKSTNGGFNWIQQNSPSIGFRNDFWFANDTVGWCTGGGGQIYKTSNGGTYVSVEPVSLLVPNEFELEQNFPNPFNSQTVFRFKLNERGLFKFEIYDILGRKLETIFNGFKAAGEYEINYKAGNLSSGLYLYKLYSVKSAVTKKFIVIK